MSVDDTKYSRPPGERIPSTILMTPLPVLPRGKYSVIFANPCHSTFRGQVSLNFCQYCGNSLPYFTTNLSKIPILPKKPKLSLMLKHRIGLLQNIHPWLSPDLGSRYCNLCCSIKTCYSMQNNLKHSVGFRKTLDCLLHSVLFLRMRPNIQCTHKKLLCYCC